MVFLPPRLERCLNTEIISLMLIIATSYLAASLNANPVMIVASDSGYRIDYNIDYQSISACKKFKHFMSEDPGDVTVLVCGTSIKTS